MTQSKFSKSGYTSHTASSPTFAHGLILICKLIIFWQKEGYNFVMAILQKLFLEKYSLAHELLTRPNQKKITFGFHPSFCTIYPHLKQIINKDELQSPIVSIFRHDMCFGEQISWCQNISNFQTYHECLQMRNDHF